MKIICKVLHEDVELTKKIANSKLVKGGVIIEIEKVIPEGIPEDHVFLIECYEEGGGMTNRGYGYVVTNERGERLKPYHIPKGYANGVHAKFTLQVPYIFTAYKHSDQIDITRYEIKIENKKAMIEEILIWKGLIDELPETYNMFSDAVKAARNKAYCYHCREPHYIKIKEEKNT